jgi:hypothetical protein
MKRFGLFARLGEDAFYPTMGAAVSSYLVTHAVDWDDWDTRQAAGGAVGRDAPTSIR